MLNGDAASWITLLNHKHLKFSQITLKRSQIKMFFSYFDAPFEPFDYMTTEVLLCLNFKSLLLN